MEFRLEERGISVESVGVGHSSRAASGSVRGLALDAQQFRRMNGWLLRLPVGGETNGSCV
jgi:hypothetical protein